MLHKHLQAHIVCKNRLSCTRTLRRSIHRRRHVRRRWVQLGQQEARLTSPLITHDIPWDRESVREKILGVSDWCFEKFLEVLVAFLVLVACFAPLGDRFAVENEDVEEGVKKQDDVGLDRDAIEQDGLWGDVKSVGHECRLDHDQGVVDVFFVQDMSGRRIT